MRYDILIWGPKPIPVAATHPMMMMVRMSMWEGGGQSIGYSCYRISFISADWALILQLSCRLPQCTPSQPNTDTNQCNVHCLMCNAHQCEHCDSNCSDTFRQCAISASLDQITAKSSQCCSKSFPHFQHLSQKNKTHPHIVLRETTL